MINECVIEGRITKDLELKTTNSGKSVLSFSIANDDGYGDKKETSFINCVVWEKLAQNVSTYCHKGSKVIVAGKIKQRSYDSNGEKKSVYELNVRDVSFLDTKEKGETKAPINIPFTQADTDDDLPF